MDTKAEELAELTSTAEEAKVITIPTKRYDAKNKGIKRNTSNKPLSQFPERVPVSMSQIRSKSALIVDELKQNEQTCAKCLDSKFCNFIWALLAIFFISVTFMTPIASMIGGWKIHKVWDNHNEATINAQCDDKYGSMVYSGTDLGVHAYTAFIFGIVDFLLLLGQCTCLYGYLYRDFVDMDRNVCSLFAGVRLFFIVVWLIYASYMFNSARVLDAHCDKNGTFYKDMYDIFCLVFAY
eukprot:UN12216